MRTALILLRVLNAYPFQHNIVSRWLRRMEFVTRNIKQSCLMFRPPCTSPDDENAITYAQKKWFVLKQSPGKPHRFVLIPATHYQGKAVWKRCVARSCGWWIDSQRQQTGALISSRRTAFSSLTRFLGAARGYFGSINDQPVVILSEPFSKTP